MSELPIGRAAAPHRATAMRICLVSEIFHPEDRGGQGQQAFALACRLRERGAEVLVATRRHFPATVKHEVIDGIAIERLPPPGIFKGKGWKAVLPTLWFLSGLFWLLLRRRRAYDVLVVQSAKAILIPTLLASRLMGKRCVIKIDALAELEQSLTAQSLAQMGMSDRSPMVRLWSRLREILLRKADAIVAISSQISNALTREFAMSNRRSPPVVCIPNGIDVQRLRGAPADKNGLRRRLGLPDGMLVTYLGRLSRAKGLPMLLEVWERLALRYPDACLVLVGAEDCSFDACETELREYVRGHGIADRVIFVGQVGNVSDYLHASDLFVLPSRSEGFGLSLIEAMAAGLPCVSTAVGVAPELIRHGTSGWIVPVDDAEALRLSLEEALAEPDRRTLIAAAGQRAVTARFDMDEVADRFLELCRSLLYPAAAARVQEL